MTHRRERATPAGRLAWLLLLSAVPAAAVGALFESFIDDTLGTHPAHRACRASSSPSCCGGPTTSRPSATSTTTRCGDALIVGASQALALNPGTSRSGITITAARFLKFDRDSAARISFLMAVPITAGAIVFKVGRAGARRHPRRPDRPDDRRRDHGRDLAGWVAIWGTLKLVRTRTYTPFVVYRIVVGVVLLGVYFTGMR